MPNDSLMTFNGPAGRTYFDRDGVLQTAGKNEIREEYDPLTGAYLGMLIESQSRTNAVPYSNAFYSGAWNTDYGTEVVKSGTFASLAGADRWKLYPKANRSRAEAFIYYKSRYSSEPSAAVITFYAQAAEKSVVYTQNFGGSSDTAPAYFDLKNGNVSVGSHFVSAKMTPIGNGIYRCEAHTTAPAYMEIGVCDAVGSKSVAASNQDGVWVSCAQYEQGVSVASSYIPTNGSPVTLPGEDARFTDPSMFNNFERGAFYLHFKTVANGCILATDYGSTRSRILFATSEELGYKDVRDAFTVVASGVPDENEIVASFSENGLLFYAGNQHFRTPYAGWDPIDGLILARAGDGWSGYIKSLDFSPTPYTDREARQLTKRDAATIIGECLSGGYYDYSDLSTMLVESDELGIPVEDRKIARVGDPIGAILDKSGHGNHMTASTDSRRGILRSDGDNYYIERGANTIYGFDFSGDYSLTAMIALQNYGDRSIVLCDQDGGSGNYAMIYDSSSTSTHLSWSAFGSPHYYMNGEFTPASNRGDTGATLQTNPIQLRTLHRVANGYTARIFVGGYTSNSWNLTGNEYGFAWASRLSEDDALVVEAEMRRNMPPVT